MSITIRRLTLLLLLLLLPAMSSCAGTEKLPAAEGPAAGDEVPVISDIDSGVYAEDTALDKNMLFQNAKKNPEFRRMFAERMHSLAEDTLAPARVAGMLDAGYRKWSRWYPDYMQRFPVSGEETPEQTLQNVKAFFEARASYILPIVDEYCNYTPGA